MREIKRHIIHASATPNERDHTAADIDVWHKRRGWSGIGYHFVIRRNGKVETGRRLERMGAHVEGHNKDSIGTCLIGAGVSINDFTPAQIEALRKLHETLSAQFKGLSLHGHREYAKKSCPGFNIPELLEMWNPPVKPRPLTGARRLAQRLLNRKS